MLALSAGKDSPFGVIAQVHPALVDPEDGKNFTIPVVMLPSKDEDAEAVKAFERNLEVKSRVETFGDMVHGWMAARADLKDEKVKKEYQRGYGIVLDFFEENL
jgi:dienelactone hydrolase